MEYGIYGGKLIVDCDVESGGCDKDYVVSITLKPEIEVFKMVEGSINV